MRYLGPGNFVFYIRYFVISVVKKQYKTKQINSLGPEKIVYYIRYFVFCRGGKMLRCCSSPENVTQWGDWHFFIPFLKKLRQKYNGVWAYSADLGADNPPPPPPPKKKGGKRRKETSFFPIHGGRGNYLPPVVPLLVWNTVVCYILGRRVWYRTIFNRNNTL